MSPSSPARAACAVLSVAVVLALLPGVASAQPTSRSAQLDGSTAARLSPDANRYHEPTWPSPADLASDQEAAAVWGDVTVLGNVAMACSADPDDYVPVSVPGPDGGYITPTHRADICRSRTGWRAGTLTEFTDLTTFHAESVQDGQVPANSVIAQVGAVDSRNNANFMRYVDADGDPSTFSSSGSNFRAPGSPIRIVHARLSWFGWIDSQASLWPGTPANSVIREYACGPEGTTVPFDEVAAGTMANGIRITRLPSGSGDADGFTGLMEEMANNVIDPSLLPFGAAAGQCPRFEAFDFGAGPVSHRSRPVDFDGIGTVRFRQGSGGYGTVTADGPVEVLKVGDGDMYFASADVTARVAAPAPGATTSFWTANVDSIQGPQGGAGWSLQVVWEYTDPAMHVEDNFNDVYVFAGPVGITCTSGCAVEDDDGPHGRPNIGAQDRVNPSTVSAVISGLRPAVGDRDEDPATVHVVAFDGDTLDESDRLRFELVDQAGRSAGTIGGTELKEPIRADAVMREFDNVAVGVLDDDPDRRRDAGSPDFTDRLNGFMDMFTVTTPFAEAVGQTATADPSRLALTLETASGGEAWAVVGVAFSVPRDQPGVEVVKRSDQSSPVTQPGTVVTYQVDVVNETALPLDDVVVVDTLPPEVTVVPGSISDAGAVVGNTIRWGPFTMARGDRVPNDPCPPSAGADRGDCFTLTYQVRTEPVGADTDAVNVVQVDAVVPDVLDAFGNPLRLTDTDEARVRLIPLVDDPEVCPPLPGSYSSPLSGPRDIITLPMD